MLRNKLLLGLACFVMTACVSAQSLGEIARQRKQAKAAASKRVITNDDLAASAATGGATAGAASSSESSAAPATASAGAAKSADKPAEPASMSPEDRKKMEDDFRASVAKQKSEVQQLERELDVLVRENKLRQATFYADAGNRLRNEAQYAADDRKYQADIDAKQQALAQARQKLEELRDQIRRAGLPTSVGE